MKLLITGFGSFPGVDNNPSAELVRSLSETAIVLDVTFEAVDDFIDGLDPDMFDLWLMVGVSNKATMPMLETVGRNAIGPQPDAAGVIAGPGSIEPALPGQFHSNLWRLFSGQLPVGTDWSTDAGTYLCNYTLFKGLAKFQDRQIGFLHIPPFEVLSHDAQANIVGRLIEELAFGWERLATEARS